MVLGVEETYTWVLVVNHEVDDRLRTYTASEAFVPVIDAVVDIAIITSQLINTFIEKDIITIGVHIATRSTFYSSSNLLSLGWILCQKANCNFKLQGIGKFCPLCLVTTANYVLLRLDDYIVRSES